MPSKRVSLKGKGADLFFGGPQADETHEEGQHQEPETIEQHTATRATTVLPEDNGSTPASPPLPISRQRRPRNSAKKTVEVSRQRDMSPPNLPPAVSGDNSYRASTIASDDAEVIEVIRKVVKGTGREVSFVRLSPDEKGRLADIVYTYKRQGVKTSENEINRIAINLLLEDYDTNGEQSVLSRVLAALQA